MGGAAAAPSAKVQAEIEFLGAVDFGNGLDPTETKGERHASDMSTAGPQPEDFEVDGTKRRVRGGIKRPEFR